MTSNLFYTWQQQSKMETLFVKHQPLLEAAIKAIHDRTFFSAYPENPSPKIYGETADDLAKSWFHERLNKPFEGLQQGDPEKWVGNEESPFTQSDLGITYPFYSADTLVAKAKTAQLSWRRTKVSTRAGILIETLERMKAQFFNIAYATMHTTGQGYMMAFQASGPHAADRALEALSFGYQELTRFPETVEWDKPMGKFNIRLQKWWKPVPKGISLVIGCSTFPTWNSVPAIYASLVTGNAVIVKPHPGAILPIALLVAEIQKVLIENGLDPNICQLAPDTVAEPLAKHLAQNEAISLIDYTGGTTFGCWLERLENKTVFTEKAGVNSVIIDSVEDLDLAMANLAFSLSLYSGQMCTAPQNFFIPAAGIAVGTKTASFDEVAESLVTNIELLLGNPKAAPFVAGAIQSPNTLERIKYAATIGKVWLESRSIENSQFPEARTASPLILEVAAKDAEIYSSELFGPVALLVKTENTAQSIQIASTLARKQGAISCAAYSLSSEVQDEIEAAMTSAGTSVSFNLTGGIYVNQNSGFSDFHVSGGNPAGNASITNPEFVIKRFTWVGIRKPAKTA